LISARSVSAVLVSPWPATGNARDTVKALLVTNEFLEPQIAELRATVSNGLTYSGHGIFECVLLTGT
jgi:hypothetical protein